MNLPLARQQDFHAFRSTVRDFLRRPFSPEWAKVVNGVGLVSLTMRARPSPFQRDLLKSL